MSDLKKVANLIIIEPPKPVAEKSAEMRKKVAFWQKRLKELQDKYFQQNMDSASMDVTEVMAMRKFLNQFVKQRIDWISEKVTDEKRKSKYLQLLPPFYQKGGVKLLLQHFFQVVESEDKQFLIYKEINQDEREIRVLWDLYKLNKTIQSIDVIYQTIEREGIPSIFSKEEQTKILQELKTVFRLMFQMCVQPAHQKELYRGITEEHINPAAILKRKEEGTHFLYPHVLQKFNYRNHFFFIYFNSGMKAKVGGEVKTFTYNFLDFEILKQEFLINWLTKTLGDNPNKTKIYGKYSLGGKNVADLVAGDPDKEIEILQQLPLNVFNDLTAQINESVAKEHKTPLDAMSETFGEYSQYVEKFDKAKKMAKASLGKLKQFVTKQAEEKPVAVPEPPPAAAAAPEVAPEPAAAAEPERAPSIEFVKLKKQEIDFPFFVKTIGEFQKNMNLQRVKVGSEGYKNLARDTTKLFNSISESSLIKRRTPKHEWILPYLVKEFNGKREIEHFVLIGAEAKAKGLGMGYRAGSTGGGTHQFMPFFVYGNNDDDIEFGAPTGTRVIRGKQFNEYSGGNAEVIKKFMNFFGQIILK